MEGLIDIANVVEMDGVIGRAKRDLVCNFGVEFDRADIGTSFDGAYRILHVRHPDFDWFDGLAWW